MTLAALEQSISGSNSMNQHFAKSSCFQKKSYIPAKVGHALYWVFHLFNSSGYMLEVDEILKHFHYNRFFVTHQTWSKFNLKDWPENYKTILGSSIFIYFAIFCK